jgi:indole-3-glycerol phosphate synthase
MRAIRDAGADACVLVYESLADEGELLEELLAVAWELGLDAALDVSDEEQLEEALERVDPEIFVLSERDREKDELETEVTLELLPDVPAGKLVVSDSAVTTREQVLELERAGVDAVLVSRLYEGPDYGATLAVLTGRD